MTNTREITLDQPIKRGDDEVTKVTMSEPLGGTMRGLQISMIQAGDVSANMKLIPRITNPSITEAELDAMPGRDIMKLTMAVVGFLLSPEDAAAMGLG